MRRTARARKAPIPRGRLLVAGAVVLTAAVAIPAWGATQAAGDSRREAIGRAGGLPAGGGRREGVGHAGGQVAAAGPVPAGLSLAASCGTTAADLAGRAARAEAAAV